MPTLDDSTAAAPAAVSVTSQKMLQLLRRRLRQLARVTIVMAVCLASGAMALAIWWLTSLNGLPDIGDPFDVAAFRAVRIPEDQNAFAYLGRAARVVTEYPSIPRAVNQSDGTVSWSQADPRLREWVEKNGHAIALFQQAGEQSDAGMDVAADFSGISFSTNMLSVLVLLEASRRQESGDTAGAWDCYRAVLAWRLMSCGGATSINDTVLTSSSSRAVGCSNGSRPGQPIREPRFRSSRSPLMKCRAPSQNLSGIRLGSKRGTSKSCAGSSSQCLRAIVRRSRENGPFAWATCRCRPTWSNRSRRPAAPSCASPSAAAAFCGCSLPTGWRRRKIPIFRPVNRPFELCSQGRGQSACCFTTSVVLRLPAPALPPQELARWLVATRDAKLQILGGSGRITGWPPNRPYRKAHRELVMMLAKELDHREPGAVSNFRQEIASAPISKTCPTTTWPPRPTKRHRQ